MSKKIYSIIFVVILVAAGFLLYSYRQKQLAPAGNSTASVNNQSAAFSLLDDKDFIDSPPTAQVESYKIGTVEFKIYPSTDMPAPAGWFEVYDNGSKVFASQPNYKISKLIAFSLGENTYVVVDDYSGGAHCCDTDYLFRINKANEVKLIKTFDMGNNSIIKESLLFKNNNLYLILGDDRFAYFHVPFSNSYFFQQYYRLDGDAITLANGDFASEIAKQGDDCAAKLASPSLQPDDNGNYWISDLACYITNYTMLGKQDAALAKFEGYFNKVFPSGSGKDAFGEPVTREGLKKEIIDALNPIDRFK